MRILIGKVLEDSKMLGICYTSFKWTYLLLLLTSKITTFL